MTLTLPALLFAAVLGTTLQTWEYDGLYRTTKAFDNNDPTVTSDDSVVTCAYDSLSRRLEEHQILGGNDKIVSSDWQDDDLRKTLVYPNGRQVGTAWDSLERLKTVTNVASYQYIGPARLLERTYQNGTRLTLKDATGTQASGYDGDKRVVQLRHLGAGNVLVAGFAYTHDRMDNRLSEDRQHNALQDQWAYDSLYRVLDQKRDIPQAGGNPGEERAWTLDGPGNWTSLGIRTFGKTAKTTTLTQSLNPLNSYTAFGGVAQADDLDGNRIDDGRFLYAWDFLHRLREVHCKTGGELVATYLCDAYGANTALNGSGRRVRKTVTADKHGCSGTFEAPKETDEMPGDTEDANDPGAEKAFAKRKASDIRYLYDGMACVEERNTITDKVLRQYVNGARVNEHLTMDVYASDGVKLKGTLFYHEDAKGWIVALTDKTGKLKERVSYDAFGMPRFENAKGKASGNQTQSKFGNPYLYGGSYFDLETRLFLMGHRFYSPAEGRFISRDPIGIWGARGSRGNPYVYIGVNGWDPEGLDGWGWLEPLNFTSENFFVYRTMEAAGRIGVGAVQTAGGVVALPFKGTGLAKKGLSNIVRGTGEVLVTAGKTTEAVGSVGGQIVKWGTYPIMQGKLGQEIYALPDTAIGFGLGILSFSKPEFSPETQMVYFPSAWYAPSDPLGDTYFEAGRFTVGRSLDPKNPDPGVLMHERIHFEQMRRVGPAYYPSHYLLQLLGYGLVNISCGEASPFAKAITEQVSFEREAYAHQDWYNRTIGVKRDASKP